MRSLPVTLVTSLVVLLSAAAATAGPTTRFGLSFGLGDTGTEDQFPIGPMVALGSRLGPVLAEVDYAYLVIAPDTGSGQMHRLGINLRGDLYRDITRPCLLAWGCTRGMSIYGEIGVAMRYVSWDLGYEGTEQYRQREAHVGVGIELDNQIFPKRYGWQLGVRVAFAPRDAIGEGCGGSRMCAVARRMGEPEPYVESSIDKSVLVEWTFLIGH